MIRAFLFFVLGIALLLTFMVFKGSLPIPSYTQLLPVPEEAHSSARNYLSKKIGVDPTVLQVFFDGLLDSSNSNQEPEECLPLLPSSKSNFISCLTDSGASIFNTDFYRELTALRIKHSQDTPSVDNQMVVSLISWIEDLIREQLISTGLSTHWYDHEKRSFITASKASEFPYEDGDIVIAIGSSAISALISAVMDPHRGYSHAMLIRKPPGENPYIIDATIEYGVSKRELSILDDSEYQQALVLRPFVNSDEKFSAEIASKASEFAQHLAESRVPYDEAMDPDQHSKLFCSELVNYSYAQAATHVLKTKFSAKDVGPSRATVRSPEAFEFLNLLGVRKKVVPSPGDLGTSSHLKVVADYRNMSNPIQYWAALLAGEAFLEGLEAGHSVSVDPWEIWPLVTLACLINKPAWLLGYILDRDLQLIPSAISCDVAKIIKTHSDKIHDRLLEVLDERTSKIDVNHALSRVSPWYIYASLKTELYDTTGAGKYFPRQ